jgi:hypothetical protein
MNGIVPLFGDKTGETGDIPCKREVIIPKAGYVAIARHSFSLTP